MFSKSFACRVKNVLLEDIKRLCEENGVEKSIITNTRTLKKVNLDTAPEEISVYPEVLHCTFKWI